MNSKFAFVHRESGEGIIKEKDYEFEWKHKGGRNDAIILQPNK